MKFFSYILSQNTLHSGSSKKIIPASEFSTLLEAKEVLEKAQEEAIAYKKNTEEDCETLKKQAWEEGFEKGLEELNKHILSVDAQVKKIYDDMQKAVLSIALKAAQKIVKEELKTYPDTIVNIVMHALAPAKYDKQITIFVNEADLALLQGAESKIRGLLEQVLLLSIKERPDVSKGGCIIETDSGIINASLEQQFDALQRAFEQYKQ